MKTKRVNPEKIKFYRNKKSTYINKTIDFLLCELTDYQFHLLRLELLEYMEKDDGLH